MKFMYIVIELPGPGAADIVSVLKLTHHTDVDELVHPDSHHAYRGAPAAAGPVVNSTLLRFAASPLAV
jgi:hypothetical protein